MRFLSHNIMTIDTNKTKICISTGQSFVRHVRKEYALTETVTRSIQIELKKRLIMSIIHQKMKNRRTKPYKKNDNKQELTNIWTMRIGSLQSTHPTLWKSVSSLRLSRYYWGQPWLNGSIWLQILRSLQRQRIQKKLRKIEYAKKSQSKILLRALLSFFHLHSRKFRSIF